MKKIISSILVISVITLLTLTAFTGCNRGSSDDPTKENMSTVEPMTGNVSETDNAASLKIDIEGQKATAEKDAAKTGGVTEDKIKEAVDYIETNLTDSTDKMSTDTLKKLAYYGAYLAYLGKRKTELADNNLVKYGQNVYNYAYNASDNANGTDSGTLRNDIMKVRDSIKAGKDKMISELNDKFNKK